MLQGSLLSSSSWSPVSAARTLVRTTAGAAQDTCRSFREFSGAVATELHRLAGHATASMFAVAPAPQTPREAAMTALQFLALAHPAGRTLIEPLLRYLQRPDLPLEAILTTAAAGLYALLLQQHLAAGLPEPLVAQRNALLGDVLEVLARAAGVDPQQLLQPLPLLLNQP